MRTISRRTFIGAVGFVYPCCLAQAFPSSESDDLLEGKIARPLKVRKTKLEGCAIRSGNVAEIAKVRVDKAGMSDLSRLWDPVTRLEGQALRNFFGLQAELGFFRDDSPNAVALRPDGTSHSDGTILIGLDLCRRIISYRGESAIVGVVAHEAAHLLQFSKQRISSAKPFDAAFPNTMAAELHADFLAGWYLNRKIYYGLLGLNVRDFSAVLEALGDNDFTAPDHHGTAEQRRHAMEAGDLAARRGGAVDAALAYKQGLTYVAQVAGQK